MYFLQVSTFTLATVNKQFVFHCIVYPRKPCFPEIQTTENPHKVDLGDFQDDVYDFIFHDLTLMAFVAATIGTAIWPGIMCEQTFFKVTSQENTIIIYYCTYTGFYDLIFRGRDLTWGSKSLFFRGNPYPIYYGDELVQRERLEVDRHLSKSRKRYQEQRRTQLQNESMKSKIWRFVKAFFRCLLKTYDYPVEKDEFKYMEVDDKYFYDGDMDMAVPKFPDEPSGDVVTGKAETSAAAAKSDEKGKWRSDDMCGLLTHKVLFSASMVFASLSDEKDPKIKNEKLTMHKFDIPPGTKIFEANVMEFAASVGGQQMDRDLFSSRRKREHFKTVPSLKDEDPVPSLIMCETRKSVRVPKLGFLGSAKVIRGIRNTSLAVDRGECIALLGSKEAGTSIFLRLLSGCLVPDCGAVLLDGRNIHHPTSDRARKITLCPDTVILWEHLTLFENIACEAFNFSKQIVALNSSFSVFGGLRGVNPMTAKKVIEDLKLVPYMRKFPYQCPSKSLSGLCRNNDLLGLFHFQTTYYTQPCLL